MTDTSHTVVVNCPRCNKAETVTVNISTQLQQSWSTETEYTQVLLSHASIKGIDHFCKEA